MVKRKRSLMSAAAQLTRADDLMSDLLDSCLWPTQFKATIKFNHDYRRPGGLDMDQVKAVFAETRRAGRSKLTEIAGTLRHLPGVQQYMGFKEPPRFELHIRLYLELFLPDCGIRFSETKRYLNRDPASQNATALKRRTRSQALDSAASAQLSRVHLAVFATRAYAVGDIIAGCRGSFADLTEEEDDMLRSDSSGKAADFSHLVNSQGKFQVFCGPARFVNHDCDNNVKLERDGRTICFRAIKRIEPDQEIVTSYGSGYFGDDNSECMCATCFRERKGFFAISVTAPDEQSIPERGRTRSGQTYPFPSTGSSASSSRPSSLAGSPRPSPPCRRPPLDRSESAVGLRRSRSHYISFIRGLNIYAPTADLRHPVQLTAKSGLFTPKKDFSETAVSSPSSSECFEDDVESVAENSSKPPASNNMPRRTYWISTKQRLNGILPWDKKPAPRPRSKLPSRCYWITSKDKELGRLPWEPRLPEPEVKEFVSKRTTMASRRASDVASSIQSLSKSHHRGKSGDRSFSGLQAELLNTPAGRELLGSRPPTISLSSWKQDLLVSSDTKGGTSTPKDALSTPGAVYLQELKVEHGSVVLSKTAELPPTSQCSSRLSSVESLGTNFTPISFGDR